MSETMAVNGLERLADALAASLGRGYTVLREDAIRDSGADLVVQLVGGGRRLLLQITGSARQEELPLATIPYVREMQEQVAPDRLMLVSYARVPDLVKRSLAASDVSVLEVSRGADLVPLLTDAITAAA
jgi:hypothetical protein